MLRCNTCDFSSQSPEEIYHHMMEHGHLLGIWECSLCGNLNSTQEELVAHIHNQHIEFTENYNNELLRRHQRDCFRNSICPLCNKKFLIRNTLDHHMQRKHPDFLSINSQEGLGSPMNDFEFIESENAHNRSILKFKAQFSATERILEDVFKKSYRPMHRIIMEKLNNWRGCKVWIQMRGLFHKDEEETTNNFASYSHSIVNRNQIQSVFNLIKSIITVQVEEFTFLKSQWVLDEIQDFSFYIYKYNPLSGSNYIPTPTRFKNKRCIVNVKNNDQKCFLWSILAYLYIKQQKCQAQSTLLKSAKKRNKEACTADKQEEERKKPNKKSKKQVVFRTRNACKTSVLSNVKHSIIDDGITYPPTLHQIEKFEKLNPTFSFTILFYENGTYDLLYNSKEEQENHVDLLLIQEDENQHFILLNTLCQFLYKKSTGSVKLCRNCLLRFQCEETLQKHKKWCTLHQVQEIKMPKVDKFGNKPTIKFKRYETQLKAPFVGFLDFEAFSVKSDTKRNTTTRRFLSNFVPCGFSWMFVGVDDKIAVKNYHRAKTDDEDVVVELIRQLTAATEELDKRVEIFKQEARNTMVFPNDENKRSDSKELCCLCGFNLFEKRCNKYQKSVRHHEHTPPYSFIGLAHNCCNLLAKTCNLYPIFVHNGGGFDFHFIIKAVSMLKKTNQLSSINIIPKSSEKYLTITLNNKIIMLDSLNFTLSSLEKLVDSKPKEEFKIIYEEFQNEMKQGADVTLLLRKVIFPYSYLTSVKIFNEPNPPRKAYKSDLTGENITQDDYNFVKKLYKSFNITTIGEHHDIYVRSDVALLADIMIGLRNLLFNTKEYGLDLAQYYTLPMLSFDCMLKLTKVEIELMTDSTMHCWVESAIRGGYCGVQALRAAAANNKYLPNYDPTKETSFIMFLDARNQYGKAMSFPLPISDYKWVPKKEIEQEYIKALTTSDDSKTGYLLEIDASFPEHLHEYFNCFPPLPYKRTVGEDEWSSSFQTPLAEKINHQPSNCQKLICDLHDKKSYIVHHKTLQLYISLGVQVSKVHDILKFSQRPFLKYYIECNTKKRDAATNKLIEDWWKLMSNACYGKTMEQVRERERVNIVFTEKLSNLLNRKPTCKRIHIIDEECTLHVMKTLKVTLNKPILTGVAILEYAKYLIYDMHYNGIKKIFGDKAILGLTDTDSLLYFIEGTEDVYQELYDNSSYFDLHKYSGIFQKYSKDENKNVIGKFKDERANSVISKFIGLRPKAYAIETYDPTTRTFSEAKKLKGVGKQAIDRQLTLQNFEDTVDANVRKYVKMLSIQSYKHNLSIVKLSKKATDPFDDKRYWLDNIRSLAFGHKDCKLYK